MSWQVKTLKIFFLCSDNKRNYPDWWTYWNDPWDISSRDCWALRDDDPFPAKNHRVLLHSVERTLIAPPFTREVVDLDAFPIITSVVFEDGIAKLVWSYDSGVFSAVHIKALTSLWANLEQDWFFYWYINQMICFWQLLIGSQHSWHFRKKPWPFRCHRSQRAFLCCTWIWALDTLLDKNRGCPCNCCSDSTHCHSSLQ